MEPMEGSRWIQQFLYWGAWLVIPFLWELGGGIFSAALVLLKYFRKRRHALDFYPRVTLLVPVFNSEDTLSGCLQSIYTQTYPKEQLEVFLVDNGKPDGCYEIFTRFQREHPELKSWWYHSAKGKSNALNKGIFSSSGKYILHIDSDGMLERDAVLRVVERFEQDPEISCMTGVVLTNPMKIGKTKKLFLKILQINELFEYQESFLVGRNFQSATKTMYTLAGAFSCFKRERLQKTQMYNGETLGEDAHMTFQIKNFVGGKTVLCHEAFFYADPTESLDKLYTQRQRWQRAELEVASLFAEQHLGGILDFAVKPSMRKLVSDHTLTFPRLIWFFAMLYLYFINYPLNLLIGANVLLYAAYVLNSFLYLAVAALFLKPQKETRKYILHRWYYCFILPLYRFILYWIRIAGTINSLTTESRWKTRTLSEEIQAVESSVSAQIRTKLPVLAKIRGWINQ